MHKQRGRQHRGGGGGGEAAAVQGGPSLCACTVPPRPLPLPRAPQAIRDHSRILMGKNTMMRRSIRLYCERTGNDQWLQLLGHMVGNVGLIFTKGDLNEVRQAALERVGRGWTRWWSRQPRMWRSGGKRAPSAGPAAAASATTAEQRACLPPRHAHTVAAAACPPAAQVRKLIDDFKVGAPARVGLVAPNDVTIPGGNTGMDPSQTSFFQVWRRQPAPLLPASPCRATT